MNEAVLGSKYFVVAGNTLQMVICSLSGLSFSRHGRITPCPLSARPRCFPYHSFICSLLGDLKKMPPMPRTFPFSLIALFLFQILTNLYLHLRFAATLRPAIAPAAPAP